MEYAELIKRVKETYRSLWKNRDKLMLLVDYYSVVCKRKSRKSWIRLSNKIVLCACLALDLNNVPITTWNVYDLLEDMGYKMSKWMRRSRLQYIIKTWVVSGILEVEGVYSYVRVYRVNPEFKKMLIEEIKKWR